MTTPTLTVYQGTYIGTIPATVGLVTTAGVITKVLSDSIKISKYFDEVSTVKVGSKNWPNVTYANITDEQLNLITIEKQPTKAMLAVRLLSSDDVSIRDVIEAFAAISENSTLRIGKESTVKQNSSNISDDALMMAISQMLN